MKEIKEKKFTSEIECIFHLNGLWLSSERSYKNKESDDGRRGEKSILYIYDLETSWRNLFCRCTRTLNSKRAHVGVRPSYLELLNSK